MQNKEKRRQGRVDRQVSVLIACIVSIACGMVFLLNYSLSYTDMINVLQERVLSIYDYLELKIDKNSLLELNQLEDREKPLYQQTKTLLESVRNATGVRYLYTAKQIEDGTFVYVVDGLPVDSADFRNAGDPIEPECFPDMQVALNGHIALPNRIVHTTWGNVFISYFPIHSEGEVVGVLGIEFDAEHQYQTFRLLLFSTPVVILFACLIAMALAVVMFKRISNPTYKDLANKDMLTDLKNRNSFETDLNNLNRSKNRQGVALLSMDLDGLKVVNDTQGHSVGDEYIKSATVLLKEFVDPPNILYRVGGDEFVAIFKNMEEARMELLIQLFRGRVEQAHSIGQVKMSVSVGFAVFDPLSDTDLISTLKRADERMYTEKRAKKNVGGGCVNCTKQTPCAGCAK